MNKINHLELCKGVSTGCYDLKFLQPDWGQIVACKHSFRHNFKRRSILWTPCHITHVYIVKVKYLRANHFANDLTRFHRGEMSKYTLGSYLFFTFYVLFNPVPHRLY
uniref:Uncharacterized protein n=1 Tax=Cacopsylla melanoneura TaxID=428564 RepID=A0A8D8ZTH9_9HEMI